MTYIFAAGGSLQAAAAQKECEIVSLLVFRLKTIVLCFGCTKFSPYCTVGFAVAKRRVCLNTYSPTHPQATTIAGRCGYSRSSSCSYRLRG